jgi:hypothetical protein
MENGSRGEIAMIGMTEKTKKFWVLMLAGGLGGLHGDA